MKLPEKTLSFRIDENDYTVKYPNNGLFIEIEAMKSLLTRDTYSSMSTGNTISSQLARYTVDMIAFLAVCCPKLKDDLKVGSLSELDMIPSKKVLKVYVKTILPWLMEWEALVNSDDEEVKAEATPVA
jgi:hypothetical protein